MSTASVPIADGVLLESGIVVENQEINCDHVVKVHFGDLDGEGPVSFHLVTGQDVKFTGEGARALKARYAAALAGAAPKPGATAEAGAGPASGVGPSDAATGTAAAPEGTTAGAPAPAIPAAPGRAPMAAAPGAS